MYDMVLMRGVNEGGIVLEDSLRKECFGRKYKYCIQGCDRAGKPTNTGVLLAYS